MTTAVGGECSACCEVRNYFSYGQEVPFASKTCQNDDPNCTIDITHSVTVTQTFSFNLGADVGTKRSAEDAFLTARDDPVEDILKATFNAVRLTELAGKESILIKAFRVPPSNTPPNQALPSPRPTNVPPTKVAAATGQQYPFS
jgi:hypothetical protein